MTFQVPYESSYLILAQPTGYSEYILFLTLQIPWVPNPKIANSMTFRMIRCKVLIALIQGEYAKFKDNYIFKQCIKNV